MTELIALWIILAVVLVLLVTVLLILTLGHAEVRLIYRKDLIISAYVLGRKFPFLFDDDDLDEDKMGELNDSKNPDKTLAKELKRQQKKLKKKRKHKMNALQLAAKEIDAPMPDELPKLTLMENLGWVTAFVKILYHETNGKVRLTAKRLIVKVGTDDAAKTAILFGVVSQAVAYLLRFIGTHFAEVERDDGAIGVVPDYVSGKCGADISLVVSLPLIRALPLVFRLLDSYEKTLAESYKKALLRLSAESAATKKSPAKAPDAEESWEAPADTTSDAVESREAPADTPSDAPTDPSEEKWD